MIPLSTEICLKCNVYYLSQAEALFIFALNITKNASIHGGRTIPVGTCSLLERQAKITIIVFF